IEKPFGHNQESARELNEIVNAVFPEDAVFRIEDRKSTRLNSSHVSSSYAVFCLKKKKQYMYNGGKCCLERADAREAQASHLCHDTERRRTLTRHDGRPLECVTRRIADPHPLPEL